MFHPALMLIAIGLVAQVRSGVVSPDAKIVGGTAASISSFPFQVSLQNNKNHFCGGSIYNSRIIVTAAHCVKAITDPKTITIRYGSAIWSSGGTLVGVMKALVHPNYSASTMQNDIALLKTSAAIVWSTNVKSVYLADTEPANNTAATISGWGTVYSGATTLPTQLQSANVKFISRTECQSKKFGYSSNIGSTMVCAGAVGKDSCQGDSGGPLIANGSQVGVVSWGVGCAQQQFPGVYSSIPKLKSFVTANAQM